jgi:hypothetical protein
MLRKATLAALCFALLVNPAFAASKAFISEYAVMAATSSGGAPAQIAAEPTLTDQAPVDFSGGAASSAVFGSQTKYIRLLCDTRCAIKLRPACSGAAATTSNKPLAADTPEYFGVQPGDCLSVIASP